MNMEKEQMSSAMISKVATDTIQSKAKYGIYTTILLTRKSILRIIVQKLPLTLLTIFTL